VIEKAEAPMPSRASSYWVARMRPKLLASKTAGFFHAKIAER
jgi:hypothetical protein